MGHQTVSGGWDHELVPDGRGETRRPEPTCPVEVALGAISGRWTTLILRDLLHGPLSFSDLRSGLPTLSAKVLTDRLTTLVSRGLVERTRLKDFPPRTVYRLTPAGHQLRPLLIELYRTGEMLMSAPDGHTD